MPAAPLLAAALAPRRSRQPRVRDADYWAFADRMQQRLDARWDEHAGYYRLGGGGVEPMANSMMLLTYSRRRDAGPRGPGAQRPPRARRSPRGS